MAFCYYQTDLGRLAIAETDGSITHVFFEGERPSMDAEEMETPILKEAARQLRQYLSGTVSEFSLPLAPEGTDYMRRVWAELQKIPYAKTASYAEIAAAVGNPKAARAVGMANNRNPIPIFIPCHRVVGRNGNLIGYRGGLAVKEKLLNLEKQHAHF